MNGAMAEARARKRPTTGMAARKSGRDDRVEPLHAKWRWFLALGVVLAIAGTLAVALPAVSTFAASAVLGAVLALAGAVKMVQSLRVKEWSGFIWQELTGAVELVGGILIYFNPLKGALAITLLIALVFLVHGILQIALAFRVRKENGWGWFAVSGLVALAASAALTLKLPYTRIYSPGAIAGISLLVAGGAYIAIALAMRRARS
ncbi:HdeD family acid-resistance protein [Chelativorans sp. AA-79]|uniref:HdeD family acid-resistance protein n=1 Tax=Chelativorans sp. AA-79 TaxID=3028735 RepID=UPI0023F985BB|nr:HdeD family acid-resistance protein [Chelativorans sp. AA-79]WEX10754.1 HdeD family acid-resistance protein [Chelativorans sp. AA-79]